jgi:hypothetical protein
VPAESIREAARIYANAERAAIYWGMGISQSTHGTDNTLSLVNLALMCGHVGKSGTGLNPLRGQNNVQGCSDSGGLPNVFTAYQRVDDPTIREPLRERCGARGSMPTPGLTATEMVDASLSGAVRGMFVLGENPMMSEPNQNHARHSLEQLEFLVCQDIFINETGEMADVILPATSFAEKDGTFTNTDRRVQRCRRPCRRSAIRGPTGTSSAISAGASRRGWGCRLSAGFNYSHPEQIWEEMRRVTPDFWGIDYARLEREGGVHWPCPSFDHPGTPFLFADEFPRGGASSGRCSTARTPSCPTTNIHSTCQHRPRPLPLERQHHDRPLAAGGHLPRGGVRDAPRRRGGAGHDHRRLGGRLLAARHDHPARSGHRPLAARHRLRPLPLRRGRGQHADARPHRRAGQDSGLQEHARSRSRRRPRRKDDEGYDEHLFDRGAIKDPVQIH